MTSTRICNTLSMDQPHFGRRLVEAREHRGLTQAELAKAAGGMSQTTLRSYEHSESPPRYRRYVKTLEHILGVTLVADSTTARPAIAPTPLEQVDPRLSQVTEARLVRTLSSRLHAAERAREAALPLVDRLAAGEWVNEAQRDAWASAIRAALAGDPSYGLDDVELAEPPIGRTPPNGAAANKDSATNDTAGTYGGPFGITGSENEPAEGDTEKPDGDSAQA